jgi:hypothetical protein
MESRDIGFISFVTFLHMEVNQTHPVKLVFCDLLLRGYINGEMRTLNRRARNRWLVLYTLLKNPGLKRQRKQFKKENDVKLETMGDYFRRRFFKKETTNTDDSSSNASVEISTIMK